MEEEPKHDSVKHGANLITHDNLCADGKPIVAKVTRMPEPGIYARRDEHVVLPLPPLRNVVETLARLRHGHAADNLSQNHEKDACADGVFCRKRRLPAREEERGY